MSIDVPDLLKPIDEQPSQGTTPKPTPLAEAARAFAGGERQDFIHSLQTVSSINPDEYGRATATERLSGIPAATLYQHRERMNELLKGNRYAAIYDQARKTANALRDGNLAAISQDDLDTLTLIEGAAADTRFEQQSTGEKLIGAVQQQWLNINRGRDVANTGNLVRLGQQFDAIDAEVTAAENEGREPYADGNVPGGFARDYLLATPEQRQVMRDNLTKRQGQLVEGVVSTSKELAELPVEPGARRAQALQDAGDSSFDATLEAITENPGFAFRTAFGSTATAAPTLLAGVFGGLPLATTVNFATEYDVKLTDVLQEAGVDLQNPRALLEALQDDALMDTARTKASRKAAGTTAVDTAGMFLASKLLAPKSFAGRSLSDRQRELANLAVQFPVQGASEGAGEAAGQLLAEGEVDAGEVLLETVAGSAGSTLDVLTFGGSRVLDNLTTGLKQSRQARIGQQSLTAASEAAVASKTRGRDAESFRAIAEQQLQGSPLETVWIPAEALQRLNQSAAIDLPKLFDQVPGLGEQFADAAARGGSVSMKGADYLAYLADVNEQLAGSVRLSVDGMSTDDAKAWTDAQEEQITQLREQFSKAPDPQAEAQRDTVGELIAAGFRRQDAEQYAAVHLSVLNNLAERTGQALQDLRQQFPLDIRSQAPEQLRAIPVDDARLAIQRLRAGDIPESGDIFGKSLGEYLRDAGGVNDEGGELAALDIDVNRVGRNRITRREGGLSLDQAAMDAWERGYFPGVPREQVGPQLIVDALRDEVAGSPRFSTEQENATLRDQAETLRQLGDFFGRLDVDLNQLSDEEALAILRNPESVQGERLNQQISEQAAENDLILAHNLSADNLRNVLEIGGLPAPSLAITRADAPIQGFGDITLIGDATLAMPSAKNPVFDADVYSPRFPDVSVKVDESSVRELITPLANAADEVGIGSRGADRIIEELQRNRLGNAVADIAYDAGLRYGYLTKVKGEAFDIPMKAQEIAQREVNPRASLIATEPLASLLQSIDPAKVEWNSPESGQIANALYSAMVNKFTAEAKAADRDDPAADGFTLANRRINLFADVDENNPEAFEVLPGITFNPPVLMKPNGLKRIADLLSNTPAEEVQQAASERQVIDRQELDRQLSERVPDSEIRAWAREQLSPAMGDKRIVKENGRTTAYTLDNLLKEMTKKVRDSEGFNYGLGNARSRGATKFKNLQQIQDKRGKVRSKSDTESAIADNRKLYDELLNALSNYHPGRGSGFGRSAWEVLPEAIGESYTIGMERALEENGFVDVPADLIEQVKEFASDLLQLPTEYFEAKPQRSVQLSEFSGAVVPSGTPDDLVQALTDAGLQVTEYAKGSESARSAAVKEASDALHAKRGNVLFQGGDDDTARGFITFTPRGQGDRRFAITLGEKRDLSTLLHELGHFYLEVMQDLAQAENAPQQLQDDIATIRAWVGAEGDAPLTTEQHEQFARGFESYLAEGKAPSPELAGAFARFKRWLIGIYKDLRRLNVELNDDVRRVFDRLVASDEQIQTAEQVSAAIPLFKDAAAAGMTEQEFAAYQNSIDLAHADARDAVEEEIAREEERRRSAFWREKSAKIREEVTEEVDTLPEYQALRALRSGQAPDGSTGTLKLNSGELAERYGTPVVRKLAFTHSRNGQPLDLVASVLGFESGDAMVKAMMGAQPRNAVIQQETERRMEERHGPKQSGEVAERALAAVHNERRGDVLAKELRRLAQVGNRRNVTSQQILKEAARRVMSERKVRDIQPAEFQRAEAKASRATYEAFIKGDLDAAYEAKQQQLLNFYLYREAVNARAEVDAIVERASKYNRSSVRARIGKVGRGYLDQIDAVMEQYEFRNVSLRQLDKRQSFREWYQAQVDDGGDPYVPEFVLENTARTNYKELSLNELQELDEFLAHLNHLASRWGKLQANKRVKDQKEAEALLIQALVDNVSLQAPRPLNESSRSLPQAMADWLKEANSSLMKLEQVIEQADGGDPNGAWSSIWFEPLAEAQHRRDDLNRKVTKEILTATREWFDAAGARAGQKVYIKGLGKSIDYNGILAAALNSGNASNLKKLLDGNKWSEATHAEVLGHMQEADWRYVSRLWEIVNSLWPDIVALEKQVNGIAPDKVEGVPVETPFGVVQGGYWPLVYDFMSPEYGRVLNNLGGLAPLNEQGGARAGTPKGHTKTRVDSFVAPIVLDVGIISNHISGVIHDLTHRVAIADARKLVTSPTVRQVMNERLGPFQAQQFVNVLDGIANDLAPGSAKGVGVFRRTMSALRSNAAVAWMGYSVSTMLNQVGGYAQALDYFAQKGQRKDYLRALAKFAMNPLESTRSVQAMSGEMRNRSINLDPALREAVKQVVRVGEGRIGSALNSIKNGHDAIRRFAFVPMQAVQSLVDAPVWMAAYEAEGGVNNHEQAVQAADRAVRLTQTAGGAKDLAPIQQNELAKFFLLVYGYASLLWNRNVDIARSAGQAVKARDVAGVAVALERFVYLNLIPAVLAGAIKGALPDGDEDDEDKLGDTWPEYLAIQTILSMTNGVPLARDIAQGYFSDFGYGGISPLGGGLDAAIRATNSSRSEAIATNLTTATGMLFGLPSSTINRPIRTWYALEEGELDDDATTIIRSILLGPPPKKD